MSIRRSRPINSPYVGNLKFSATQDPGSAEDNYVLTYDATTGEISLEAATGGGASQLTDLSDVSTAATTNRFALMANGSAYVGRALVEADISDLGSYAAASHTHVEADITDLGTYLTAAGNETITGNWTFDIDAVGDLYVERQSASSASTITYGNTGGELGSIGFANDGYMYVYGPGATYDQYFRCNGTWVRTDNSFLADGGTYYIKERTAALTDYAGYAQFWVKTQTPNSPRFTDDAGTDFAIAMSSATTGGTGSAGAGNQYVELNINGTTYKVLHDGTV